MIKKHVACFVTIVTGAKNVRKLNTVVVWKLQYATIPTHI